MKKYYLSYATLFVLFFWQFITFAQASLNLHFRPLRAQEGLSESTNAFISRDSRGYIWLSSFDGLNRFDGHVVKTYKPDNSNPNAINGEIGQSQFWEDIDGNLWFCTYTALNCYIRNQDSFRSWQVSDKNNADYSFIHLSSSGQLWFMANNELFNSSIYSLLEQNKFSFHAVPVRPHFAQDKKFVVKTDRKGELTGFYSYRNFEGGMHYWHINEHKKVFLKNLFRPDARHLNVQQALSDPKDNRKIWLICNEGLYCYDVKTDHLLESVLAPPNTTTVFNGGVWITPHLMLVSTNNGLLGVQPGKKKIAPLTSASSLWGKSIQELYLDPQRVLWASIKGEGVYYTNVNGLKFEFLPTFGKVVGLIETQVGSVWTAQESGLMSKYWKKEQIQKSTLPSLESIPPTNGHSVVATSARQIFLFDSNKGNWLPIFAADPDWNFSAHLLPNENAALICTTNGIKKLDLTNPFTASNFDTLESFRSNSVSNLFFDHQNHHYFLSFNQNEIWIYSKQHNNWRKWKRLTMNARFNHHTLVPALNEYWIANSKGVLCINRKSGKSRWLSNQHGKIRQNIQSLAVDSIGHIWLVGTFKVMQYNPKTKTTQSYSWDDGLFAGQFSDGAICTTQSGEIWIGGEHGINIFNPSKFKPNPNLAQIALQEFKINDTPIRDRSPNEIKNLTLPWHQNNLFFHLVAIEYTAPKNNQLEYQLKGWEKSANLAGPTASVKYNRLTPGKYTLRVRAANNNGIWTPWQEKMKLEIRPPFWQTLSFQILATLLIIGLIWGAIQLYIREKLRKERFLSAQKDARIKEQQRILREVHDDLGSNLTSIQQLRRKVAQSNSNGSSGDFEAVCDLSIELFSRLGEVIVNLDEGPIALSQLLQKLERHSKRYLSIQNNIDTIVETPPEIPTLELSNATRQHIELMVKECLHNIVKHAQASRVKMQFQFAENLCIFIQDNGIGLEEVKINTAPETTLINLQKQGNGLRNLHARALEIGGSISWQKLNPGTKVSIKIPLPK